MPEKVNANNLQHYRFNVDNADTHERYFEFLREWAGARTGILWLLNMQDRTTLSIASRVFEGMRVDVLKHHTDILTSAIA